jgi:hypothetical protein
MFNFVCKCLNISISTEEHPLDTHQQIFQFEVHLIFLSFSYLYLILSNLVDYLNYFLSHIYPILQGNGARKQHQ